MDLERLREWQYCGCGVIVSLIYARATYVCMFTNSLDLFKPLLHGAYDQANTKHGTPDGFWFGDPLLAHLRKVF